MEWKLVDVLSGLSTCSRRLEPWREVIPRTRIDIRS